MYKILKKAALCGFFKVHPIINIIFAIMVIGFGIRKDEPFSSQPSYQDNGFGIRKDEPFGSQPPYPGGFSDNVQFGQGY